MARETVIYGDIDVEGDKAAIKEVYAIRSYTEQSQVVLMREIAEVSKRLGNCCYLIIGQWDGDIVYLREKRATLNGRPEEPPLPSLPVEIILTNFTVEGCRKFRQPNGQHVIHFSKDVYMSKQCALEIKTVLEELTRMKSPVDTDSAEIKIYAILNSFAKDKQATLHSKTNNKFIHVVATPGFEVIAGRVISNGFQIDSVT